MALLTRLLFSRISGKDVDNLVSSLSATVALWILSELERIALALLIGNVLTS
jgi:hypothetical protein